jgi:hypothetical protein
LSAAALPVDEGGGGEGEGGMDDLADFLGPASPGAASPGTQQPRQRGGNLQQHASRQQAEMNEVGLCTLNQVDP